MKTSIIFFSIISSLILAVSALADDSKAREIMQLVEDRDRGDNMVSDVEMILIDKRGNQRIRAIKAFSQDRGDDRYAINFFLHPADVEGTSSLTYDYDDAEKDDDQWLYMPALGKVKRIASSDQSGSYMGSDLNYSDLTENDVEDYEYTLLKEDEVRGEKVWVIQSVPRNEDLSEETGYSKSVSFIRQDNYVSVRAVRWVYESNEIKYFDVKKLEQIDGIWMATETHVTTKKGKKTQHKTVLKRHNVRFNQELDAELFAVRQLEKGVPSF